MWWPPYQPLSHSAQPRVGRESWAARSALGGRSTRNAAAAAAASAHAGVALSVQERGDAIDGIRPIVPGPVPGMLQVQDLRLAAERVRVGVRELGGHVGIAIAPNHERRAVDPREIEPGAGQRVLRARAVELQDRALSALVEVRPGLV